MLTMSSHPSLIPHLKKTCWHGAGHSWQACFVGQYGMSACFFPSGLNMARNEEATTISIIQRHIIEKEH